MQNKTSKQPKQGDVAAIASLTPFTEEDLAGQTFGRGNMLGGANPVVESGADAPWKAQD